MKKIYKIILVIEIILLVCFAVGYYFYEKAHIDENATIGCFDNVSLPEFNFSEISGNMSKDYG